LFGQVERARNQLGILPPGKANLNLIAFLSSSVTSKPANGGHLKTGQ